MNDAVTAEGTLMNKPKYDLCMIGCGAAAGPGLSSPKTLDTVPWYGK
jgi:hypothetical protein